MKREEKQGLDHTGLSDRWGNRGTEPGDFHAALQLLRCSSATFPHPGHSVLCSNGSESLRRVMYPAWDFPAQRLPHVHPRGPVPGMYLGLMSIVDLDLGVARM